MTPRDVDNLTAAEFDLLCAWIDEYQRQTEKQTREASRG